MFIHDTHLTKDYNTHSYISAMIPVYSSILKFYNNFCYNIFFVYFHYCTCSCDILQSKNHILYHPTILCYPKFLYCRSLF